MNSSATNKPLTDTHLRTGLIVLAAGSSSRMGKAKQLLPVQGTTMIARVVESALASSVWPVIVVVGASAAEIKPAIARYPVLIAENATWMEGMASSLRTGITTLQSFSRTIDAALIALCDQPGFETSTIERLLSEQRRHPQKIIASRYGGRLGAPALFPRDHFTALSAMSGDEGARHVISAASALGAVCAVDLPELALDLDTPDDYARLKAKL